MVKIQRTSGHGNPFGLRQRLYELRVPMGSEAQVAQVVTGRHRLSGSDGPHDAKPAFLLQKSVVGELLVNCQIVVIDFALPISKADQCLGFCLVFDGILRWQPPEI